MGRSRRVWGVVAGLCVLVPVALAALFVARIDADDIRSRLIAAVENATGRTLTLGPDLRFTRSLWPTVEINQVALSNLPGGSRKQMATAERIVVTLSLPALLQRRLELTRLVLIGPNILFEQVGDVPNWRFDLPPAPGDSPAPPATPFELAILRTHVQNGMVTWRLPKRTKVVGIRSADVTHDKPDGSIQMRSTLVYSDNAPFDFSVDARPTGALADPWRTRLHAAAFDSQLSATGTLDTAGQYELQLDGTFGTLDKLNALLPEMGLPAIRNMAVSLGIGNGRQNGDLPVIGAGTLRFDSAALPGLAVGPTTIAVDKPGGTATIASAGIYQGQAVALSGTAGVPLYLDGPASVPLDLTLRTGSSTLGIKGRMAAKTLVFDGYAGGVSLATPALAGLRPLEPGLPALTKLQLTAQVAVPAAAGSLSFSAARLQAEQGELRGAGRVEPGPKLTATLQSPRLDLGATLEAFGFDLTPGPPSPGPTVIPDTPIDWSALRGPALDIQAKADAVTFADATWHGVDLGLKLEAGHLRDASLSVLTGTAPTRIAVTADATARPVPVRLTIASAALPLALVARYAGLPGAVSGTARIDAHLDAAGDTPHQLAATLTGDATIVSLGGRMENRAFIALAGPALTALGITVPAQGETVLRCLGVQSSFTNGAGRLTTIAMETNHLALEGTGAVDLRHETLTLRIQPWARVSGSDVKVPVTIEGPLRHLNGHLDADLGGKLGIFVNALFGGDEATACKDAGLVPQ